MKAVGLRLGASLEYQGATGGSRSMFLVQHDDTRDVSIAMLGAECGNTELSIEGGMEYGKKR